MLNFVEHVSNTVLSMSAMVNNKLYVLLSLEVSLIIGNFSTILEERYLDYANEQVNAYTIVMDYCI